MGIVCPCLIRLLVDWLSLTQNHRVHLWVIKRRVTGHSSLNEHNFGPSNSALVLTAASQLNLLSREHKVRDGMKTTREFACLHGHTTGVGVAMQKDPVDKFSDNDFGLDVTGTTVGIIGESTPFPTRTWHGCSSSILKYLPS